MAHKYFTKELLAKSNEIDLATIFPEKQQKAKELLNTNYSLSEIANWMKDNTNNFKSQQNYFIDLDQAIRKLVDRFYESTNAVNPFSPKEEIEIENKQPRIPAEVGSEAIKSDKAVVEEVKVADANATLDVMSKLNDEIASIKEAIDYLQGDADAGDEESKEALDYLKDELETITKSI